VICAWGGDVVLYDIFLPIGELKLHIILIGHLLDVLGVNTDQVYTVHRLWYRMSTGVDEEPL